MGLLTILLPVWWFSTSVPRSGLSCGKLLGDQQTLEKVTAIEVHLISPLSQFRQHWNNIFGIWQEIHLNTIVNEILLLREKVKYVVVDGPSIDTSVDLVTLAKSLPLDKCNQEYCLYLVEHGEAGKHIIFTGKSFILASNDLDRDHRNVVMKFYQEHLAYKPTIPYEDTVADSPSYQITMTMVVGQNLDGRDGLRVLDWEVEEASKRYLFPLIKQLQSIADISVQFKIEPIGELPFNLDEDHVIRKEHLPVFVDENKWRIGGSISDSAPINLILYVPPINKQPMQIEDNGSMVFRYARWGSVYILNYPDGQRISADQLKPVMSAFAGQLCKHFGLVCDGSSSQPINLVVMNHLLTRLIISRFQLAISTLRSLDRLLKRYTEISILPTIDRLTRRSSDSLRAAQTELANGKTSNALHSASWAVQYADAAFFHPSMMAHQYFPQEHKLGVYMPLFFPFIIPVILASISVLLQRMKGKAVKIGNSNNSN